MRVKMLSTMSKVLELVYRSTWDLVVRALVTRMVMKKRRTAFVKLKGSVVLTKAIVAKSK